MGSPLSSEGTSQTAQCKKVACLLPAKKTVKFEWLEERLFHARQNRYSVFLAATTGNHAATETVLAQKPLPREPIQSAGSSRFVCRIDHCHSGDNDLVSLSHLAAAVFFLKEEREESRGAEKQVHLN